MKSGSRGRLTSAWASIPLRRQPRVPLRATLRGNAGKFGGTPAAAVRASSAATTQPAAGSAATRPCLPARSTSRACGGCRTDPPADEAALHHPLGHLSQRAPIDERPCRQFALAHASVAIEREEHRELPRGDFSCPDNFVIPGARAVLETAQQVPSHVPEPNLRGRVIPIGRRVRWLGCRNRWLRHGSVPAPPCATIELG